MDILKTADIAGCFAESTAIFLLFNTYMRRREFLPKYVYWVTVLVLGGLIYMSNNFMGYALMNAACMVVMSISASLLYETNMRNRIVFPLVGFLLSGCMEIIVMFAMSVLLGVDKTDTYLEPHLRLLGIALSKTLLLITVRGICMFGKKHTRQLTPVYWGIYAMIFAVTISTVYALFVIPTEDRYLPLSGGCAVGLLCCSLLTLYLYDKMSDQAEWIREKEFLERQLKDRMNHLNELIPAQQEIRAYHDLANHLISLKAYLEQHSYSEGEQYLEKLMETTGGRNVVFNTGNIVIDAIFTAKHNAAKRLGIEFGTELCIPPGLRIDDNAFCIILGNALDNAIEACEKLPGKGYVNARMVHHDDILSCKIVNSAPKATMSGGRFKSGKSGSMPHGIGLKNIEGALKEYNAIYKMEYANSEFVFSFMIANIKSDTGKDAT